LFAVILQVLVYFDAQIVKLNAWLHEPSNSTQDHKYAAHVQHNSNSIRIRYLLVY